MPVLPSISGQIWTSEIHFLKAILGLKKLRKTLMSEIHAFSDSASQGLSNELIVPKNI
jgi:hypothetical protein